MPFLPNVTDGLKKGVPSLVSLKESLANNVSTYPANSSDFGVSSDILLKSLKIWSPFGLMNNWSYMLKSFKLDLARVWLKNAYHTAVLHSFDPMKLLLFNR